MTAESWEVSAHPAGASVVDAGPLAGRDLPGLAAEFGELLVGRRSPSGIAAASGDQEGRGGQAGRGVRERRGRGGVAAFPLLVKLLDASHALSVQVHPDDDLARELRLGESGKTEWWHILHARRGARIIHGLRSGTDPDQLRRAAERGTVQDVLRRVPVHPGDSFLVPAGTVHGILSGVVLVEIQQSSDTTYRIHDWGRLGPDGRPRELHLERALDAIRFGAPVQAPVRPRAVGAGDGIGREVVADCDHFVVERIEMDAGARFTAELTGATFEVWGALAGTVRVNGAARPDAGARLEAIRFALLPATMGRFYVRAATRATLLRSYLPA